MMKITRGDTVFEVSEDVMLSTKKFPLFQSVLHKFFSTENKRKRDENVKKEEFSRALKQVKKEIHQNFEQLKKLKQVKKEVDQKIPTNPFLAKLKNVDIFNAIVAANDEWVSTQCVMDPESKTRVSVLLENHRLFMLRKSIGFCVFRNLVIENPSLHQLRKQGEEIIASTLFKKAGILKKGHGFYFGVRLVVKEDEDDDEKGGDDKEDEGAEEEADEDEGAEEEAEEEEAEEEEAEEEEADEEEADEEEAEEEEAEEDDDVVFLLERANDGNIVWADLQKDKIKDVIKDKIKDVIKDEIKDVKPDEVKDEIKDVKPDEIKDVKQDVEQDVEQDVKERDERYLKERDERYLKEISNAQRFCPDILRIAQLWKTQRLIYNPFVAGTTQDTLCESLQAFVRDMPGDDFNGNVFGAFSLSSIRHMHRNMYLRFVNMMVWELGKGDGVYLKFNGDVYPGISLFV